MLAVAFYIGKGDWKDKVIRFWKKTKYSHVELIYGPGDNIYRCNWITASPRWDGVCKYNLHKENRYYEKNWEIIRLDTSNLIPRWTKVIDEIYTSIEGSKYDWLGLLFNQGASILLEDKDKWYCSELIVHILNSICYFNSKVPTYIDFATLYKTLKDKQCQLTSTI